MSKAFRRKKWSWVDELRLEYWRQLVQATRLIARLKAWLVPLRGYLWLPVVAGLAGMVLGLLIRLA